MVYDDDKAGIHPYLRFCTDDYDKENPDYTFKCEDYVIYSDNYLNKDYVLETANYAALRGMQFRDPIDIQNHTELQWNMI